MRKDQLIDMFKIAVDNIGDDSATHQFDDSDPYRKTHTLKRGSVVMTISEFSQQGWIPDKSVGIYSDKFMINMSIEPHEYYELKEYLDVKLRGEDPTYTDKFEEIKHLLTGE